MPYHDRSLTCQECGQPFVFTAGEQEFFASRGFSEPRRCPSCRAARKRERRGEPGARPRYPAVCAQCGRPTQVPFQPRGDRPVYCPDCYRQRVPPRPKYGRAGGS